MADRGKRLDYGTVSHARRLARGGNAIRAVARLLGLSRNTVRKYLRQPVEV